MSVSDDRFAQVMELAEEFLDRYRNGERPPLKEYTDRHPDISGEIREIFPAMAMMENIALDSESRAPIREAITAPLQQLGDYRIIREVGRGGMGVVYEAEQVSLGRHVALKVLQGKSLLDDRQKQRFEREAKAAAKLHHTNIVPVFGVGECDGTPYYVMQFIQGLGLDAVLIELRRMHENPNHSGDGEAAGAARSLVTGVFPKTLSNDGEPNSTHVNGAPRSASCTLLTSQDSPTRSSSSVTLPGHLFTDTNSKAHSVTYWQSVAQIGIQVAEALDYASKQGILHRDIKPSNLLLDARGTVWVTDFGLAKADDQQNITHTGDIVGTLRFMPPERFRGRGDLRSDLYSLGLTLYELLTFRPAFDEKDHSKLVAQVLHTEPMAPRCSNPAVPRDLETIVLKCIAREPEKRYQSAAELCDDLHRFLVDEPIKARRISPVERVSRWCRRNPTATALIGVSTLAALAVVGLAVGLWYNRKLHGALDDTEKLRGEANQQRERFENLEVNTRYLREISQAQEAWREARISQALRLLDHWRPKQPDEPDLRGWEWYYLNGLCHKDFRTLEVTEPSFLCSAAFHPDNRRIAVGDWQNNTIHIWDVVDGRKLDTLKGHTDRVSSVAFSPDGSQLASASCDNTVRLWDVASGQEVYRFRHNRQVRAVAFSTDGRYLASGGFDQAVVLWDLDSRKVIRRFLGHTGEIYCVTFSLDGRRVASCGQDRTAKIWDVATGQCLHTLVGHAHQVSGVAFSPNGQTLATSAEEGLIKLWDANNGKLRHTLEGHTSWVYSIAFSPDGRWLASVSDDMTVRLWDATHGKEARILRGHGSSHARGIAFSPDGRFIVTTAKHQVKVWDLARGPQEYRLLHPIEPERIGGVAFTADGRLLATASRDRTVRIWEIDTGRQLRILTGHQDEVWCVAFGAGDKLLASGSFDGIVKLWNPNTGTVQHTLAGSKGPIMNLALSADGQWVAASGLESTVNVWDATSGKRVQTLSGHTARSWSLAFSPDGRLLASAGADKTVRLWDTETWQGLRTLDGFTEELSKVAFSPDGKTLATAGRSGHDGIKLWNPVDGRLIRTLEGFWGNINSITFSRDARRLGAAGGDLKIKIWDTSSGQEVLTLKGNVSTIYSIAFSPDGRSLASASFEGLGAASVRLWEAPPEIRTEAEDRAALLTPEYVLCWHLNEAEDCLRTGQLAVARWHVERLGNPPLTDALLNARLVAIRAAVAR